MLCKYLRPKEEVAGDTLLGAYLWVAFPVECVEILVLKSFADLRHAVSSEVEKNNCIAVLHPELLMHLPKG